MSQSRASPWSIQPPNANCQLLIAAVQCLQHESHIPACYTRRLTMPSRYAQWMYDWEHRLTSVDNNRVVRPLEWGVEWTRDWPCRNGYRPGQIPSGSDLDAEKYFLDFNRRIVANSDEFYSYARPTHFRLAHPHVHVFSTPQLPDPNIETKVQGTFGEFLRFTS